MAMNEPFRLHEKLHPNWWKSKDFNNERGEFAADPELVQARKAHTDLAEAITRLGRMSETPDPYKTKAAHLKSVQDESHNMLTRLANPMKAARDTIDTGLRGLDREIAQSLPETKHAAEVRTHLRGLSTNERSEIIANAISSGDAETLGAVVNGPAYLSGISAERQRTTRESYIEAAMPDLSARRKRLLKAQKVMTGAFDIAIEQADSLIDRDAITKAEQQAQAARHAMEFAPVADSSP